MPCTCRRSLSEWQHPVFLSHSHSGTLRHPNHTAETQTWLYELSYRWMIAWHCTGQSPPKWKGKERVAVKPYSLDSLTEAVVACVLTSQIYTKKTTTSCTLPSQGDSCRTMINGVDVQPSFFCYCSYIHQNPYR